MNRTAIASSLLLLLGPGCESTDSPREKSDLRPVAIVLSDSAGVPEFVHSGDWESLEEWSIKDPPSVEVGELDGAGPYVFAGVVGGALLEGGGLVIADRSSRELRFFGSEGVHDATAGGLGSGPLEFLRLRFPGRVSGDTLAAADPQARKVLLFDRSGEHVGSYGLPLSSGLLFPTEVTEEGIVSVEVELSEEGVPEGAVQRGLRTLRGSTWSGEPQWVVGPLPADETAEKDGISGKIAFGRDLFTSAGRSRVFVANNDDFRIRAYDARGELLHIIVWEARGEEPRAGDFEAFMTEELSVLGDPEFSQLIHAWAREVPSNLTTPVFSELFATYAGELWVKDGRHPSDPWVWWVVFDHEGTASAKVRLPRSAKLLDAHYGRLLLLQRDELGVERVRIHELLRS